MDLGFQEIRTDSQILLPEVHYSNALELVKLRSKISKYGEHYILEC
jgi:hypothetical protein